MARQSEEALLRARTRRDERAQLGSQMAQIRAGPSGMGAFSAVVRNDAVKLADRLDAIDAALVRGLITSDELERPGAEPRPEEFGLESDRAPTILPRLFQPDPNTSQITNMRFALFVAIIVVIMDVAYTSAHEGVIHALVEVPFTGLAATFGALIGLMPVIMIANSMLPGAAAYRRFTGAKNRYQAVLAARSLMKMKDDVRAYEHCSGPEFERLVARAFLRKNFRVQEMGGPNDGGVDLLVWKGGFHAIVQCKAHSKPVGPATVRDLVGALNHHEGASVAYLATTKGVTQSAVEWCTGKPIVFLQPDDLIQGRIWSGRALGSER